MPTPNIVTRWSTWGPELQGVLRIAAAVPFILAGTIKLFAIPVGVPPDGGTVPWMSQMGFGAFLEAAGGLLVLFGLFTRPVAFLLSGEMAVAYFQFHFAQGFWPNTNGGMPAFLYCFLWFFFSAAGPGRFALDAKRARRNRLGS